MLWVVQGGKICGHGLLLVTTCVVLLQSRGKYDTTKRRTWVVFCILEEYVMSVTCESS